MDTLLEPHSLVVSVVGVVEAYRSHVQGHSMQAMTRSYHFARLKSRLRKHNWFPSDPGIGYGLGELVRYVFHAIHRISRWCHSVRRRDFPVRVKMGSMTWLAFSTPQIIVDLPSTTNR